MHRALPFVLLLLAATPAAAQHSISPGYWETTNRVISPFPTSKTEKRCIRRADVAKFMQGPGNHIYACTYPTREIGDGTIHLVGSCATRTGKPVPVRGEGVFTADTLRMDAHVDANLGGMTVQVHARTTARRLGDTCPAEARESKKGEAPESNSGDAPGSRKGETPSS